MPNILDLKILGIKDAKVGWNNASVVAFEDVPYANNFTMSNASTQITFEGDATSDKVFSDNELSGTLVADKLSPKLLERLFPGKANIDTADGFPVDHVTVGSGGSGYSTAPTVTFAAPNTGTHTATGHATVAAGAITAIIVDDPGAGYTTAPVITLGGPGTGGAATSVLGALPAGTTLRGFGGDNTEFAQAPVELVVTAAVVIEYDDGTTKSGSIVYTVPKANISPLQMGNLANRAKQSHTVQWTAVKTTKDIVGTAIFGMPADGANFYYDIIPS